MRTAFDPADTLDDLANHGVTQLQGPPTLFSRLLAHMEQIGVAHPPAPQLRYVYTGAGPLDMALKQRVEAPSASRCTTATACRNTRDRST